KILLPRLSLRSPPIRVGPATQPGASLPRMAAMPASPVTTISPAEMQILISRSGLVLNPGQMADLVLAWRQVAGLIATLPHGRPLADDLAYNFRLVPPTPAEALPSGK